MYRLTRIILGVTTVAILGVGSLLAQAPQKKVKDQGEYDLFTAVTKETDPNKRLASLDQWKSKYPDTDYKKERLQFYLNTYKEMNQAAKMWDVAKEILTVDPKDVTALYWLTLLVESLPPGPDIFDTGAKAANGLLVADKPQGVKDEDWAKMTGEFAVIAHKTLGYIANQKKDFPTAEAEFKKVLEKQANFALVSYSLGAAIIAQKNPDRYSEALYHMARAVSLTGVGELPAANKKTYEPYLIKAYNTYHGSADGLPELREKSKASAVWPPDLKIKSKVEIAFEDEEKLKHDNPQLALWKSLKDQLTAADGDKYWEDHMKGSAPPAFKGKIVATTPEAKPKEITLWIMKPDVAEVKLVVEGGMPTKAEPGTELEFEGVPSSYQKDPFLVTFDVEKEKIKGWPAPPAPKKAAPAAKKAAPAAKKAAAKK